MLLILSLISYFLCIDQIEMDQIKTLAACNVSERVTGNYCLNLGVQMLMEY